MSHESVGGQSLSKSSPNDKAESGRRHSGLDLPPISSREPTSAARDAAQLPPNVAMRPTPPPSSTPPEQRSARPIGVENLLNPSSSGGNVSSGPRSQYGERSDSPRTAPFSGLSRPVSPSNPSISTRKSSSGDISLPSITPPLINAIPHQPRAMTPRSPTNYGPGPITTGLATGNIDARQSPFLLHREQAPSGMGPGSASGALPATYNPSATRLHSPRTRQATHTALTSRPQIYPAASASIASTPFPDSRSSSPMMHQPRSSSTGHFAQPGQPQSFFTSPFSSLSGTAAIQPGSFEKKSTATSSQAQGQFPVMTLETESGTIQVPVDIQAASKVADEKRKRNATASHRFRQRRKEKEHETQTSIARLEQQMREVADEKDFYQRERDFFHEVILRHRIPIPPRPASPRRRRRASMGGSTMSQYQDPESGGREEGRNTRRRTSAYAPPQGPPPAAEPQPPMPAFERMSALPAENLPSSQQQRQGPFPPGSTPFPPAPPR